MSLIKNKFFVLFLILYAASLGVLSQAGVEMGQVIAIFVIIGICFSGLGCLATIRANPLALAIEPTRREMPVLFILVIFVTLYLVWGGAFINNLLPADWIESPQIKLFVILAKKLLVFVIIPFGIFRFLFGYRPRDFGLSSEAFAALFKNHLPPVVLISIFICIFQLFLGGGAATVRDGELSSSQLLIDAPIYFLWLALEVGLVEEFFFRALLQTRLTAFFKSEITGIILMALVFGLAHAPGIFLRGGAADELGDNPSFLTATAYSIAVLTVAGFFLGIVWSRTKNLFAVIIIHAVTDLLPNLAEFVKIMHLK